MQCHEDSRTLPPQPDSARLARQFVRQVCTAWDVEQDVRDTAVLLTSELVTNGVLHARTEVAIRVRLADGELSVEVEDHDPRPPVKRSERADLLADIDELLARDLADAGHTDERHAVMHVGPAGSIGAGRGLLLVETLADEWGVTMNSGGKAVWFRVALDRGQD